MRLASSFLIAVLVLVNSFAKPWFCRMTVVLSPQGVKGPVGQVGPRGPPGITVSWTDSISNCTGEAAFYLQ